jgi:hypothetical protein
MKSFFVDGQLQYTGSQLRPNWPKERFGIDGDCIVSFLGPTALIEPGKSENDVSENQILIEKMMLHFIVEHFAVTAREIILLHQLFLSLAVELLGAQVYRRINNLYSDARQLSICKIRAGNPSSLFHLGLHLDQEQSTHSIGLNQLRVPPQALSLKLMNSYSQESRAIFSATGRPKPEREHL